MDQFFPAFRAVSGVTHALGRSPAAARGGGFCCCSPLFIVISVMLLFWNEGRSVGRYRDLQESLKLVTNVDDISSVDSSLEGKLVHMTGDYTSGSDVKDSTFGVSTNGIKLVRNVQMYQWDERSYEDTRTKDDGSTETFRRYHYNNVWSNSLINSNYFAEKESHENPSSMKFSKSSITAEPIILGAFTLSSSIVDRMNWFQALNNLSVDNIPEDSAAKDAKVEFGSEFYFGKAPLYPEVGDTKVSFQHVPPGTISLMAMQTSDSSFSPYTTSRGGQILFVQRGNVSSEDMLLQAAQENEFGTWVLRIVGFGIMYMGLHSLLSPLVASADLIIPCLGNAMEYLVSMVSGIVAGVSSATVISIAWIYYRPLLGILMLSISGAIYYFGYKRYARYTRVNSNESSASGDGTERKGMVMMEVA
eukprot:CAMPEP_0178912670 /NCGR_PEP_ID=MMETSP0786-20121207/10404_1 /TAXON_ID=186022 /ORGANISM="Thalassionema frauenfeldii, Strain CCMP 1798" /LENGTH=417 /DNA_ID=CAMNT_0020585303 /DNA_START=67 /DNA_END=1320 /DNA_ORIENTATION=-